MKTDLKLAFIFIVMSISLRCSAQTNIGVMIEPLQQQLGLNVSQKISNYYGIYTKARYGRFNFEFSQTSAFKASCLKTGIGIVRHNYEYEYDFLLGLNYYHFNITQDNNPFYDINRLHIISFDIGFNKYINENWYVFAQTDFINWETELGFGYRFQYKNYENKCIDKALNHKPKNKCISKSMKKH